MSSDPGFRILTFLLLFLVGRAFAQEVDSLHVFRSEPPTLGTSASANALIWKLHHEGAEYDLVVGASLGIAMEAMQHYRPTRYSYGSLDGLRYLVMAFSGGRPMAVGITGDLDRVINFTARKEYCISTWDEHLRVRAMLAKLLLER